MSTRRRKRRKGPPAPERGGAVHEGRSKQELAAQLAAMTPPKQVVPEVVPDEPKRQVVPDETPGASHPHAVMHFYHEPLSFGGTRAEIFGHHTSTAIKVI